MNLIEQLGGYEKAKTVVDKAPCKTYTYHNHPYQKGYIRCWGGDGKEYFLVSDIEQTLLEYRRQHNIYEAGDLVVMVDADDYSTIFKVIGKPQRLYHLQGNDDLFYGRLDFQIRHAMDAEIEAGKRLEVNQ